MLGNYVNLLAVILGCLLGLMVRKGMKEAYKKIIMQAIALSVLFVGSVIAIGGLLHPESKSILFIISLVVGGLIGELLGIEKVLTRFGMFLQSKVGTSENNVAHGFVTASLIFCVGTMAIVGSLESGLRGNHDILFAKSVIDGVTAMVLASTLGIGVIFSAAAVFIYQGFIIIFSGYLESFLTEAMIREISIIGGILIFGIGLTMLKIIEIKTVNLLPAVLIPVIYYIWIMPLFT
mgnify:CR=1 FL=1